MRLLRACTCVVWTVTTLLVMTGRSGFAQASTAAPSSQPATPSVTPAPEDLEMGHGGYDNPQKSPAEQRQRAWEILERGLHDAKHPEVRVEALRGLSELRGNARAIKLITSVSSDKDPEVQESAAAALTRCNSPAETPTTEHTEQSRKALILELKSKDEHVRLAAVEQLGSYQGLDLPDALGDRLGDRQPEFRVAVAASFLRTWRAMMPLSERRREGLE